VFVETKTFAEQLSGTLAIAYEVSDSASLSFFAFFSRSPDPRCPDAAAHAPAAGR